MRPMLLDGSHRQYANAVFSHRFADFWPGEFFVAIFLRHAENANYGTLNSVSNLLVDHNSPCYDLLRRVRAPPVRGKDSVPLDQSTLFSSFNELFSARVSGHRAQRLTRDTRGQERS